MRKEVLPLVLIGILITPFLLISRELPARTYTGDDVALKEEPSGEINQLYKELKLKISQLENMTDLPPDLRDAQKEIEEISLKLKNAQPKVEPETAESRSKIKLTPDSRALINKKRELQAKLHIANAPLEALKDRLATLLEKKRMLELNYLLVPIEIPILAKTASELNEPIIIIEGKVELKRSDDIIITLVLSRSVAASAFCEIYLNNVFVNRERWKIGSAGEFTTTIAATHEASPRQGLNYLAIVLNTSCQEDDVVLESPPFVKNPLTILSKSKIAARNLISGSFELKQKDEKETPVEGNPQPPSE